MITPGDTVQRCHFYMDGIFKLVATDKTTVHVENLFNGSNCVIITGGKQ